MSATKNCINIFYKKFILEFTVSSQELEGKSCSLIIIHLVYNTFSNLDHIFSMVCIYPNTNKNNFLCHSIVIYIYIYIYILVKMNFFQWVMEHGLQVYKIIF
jgi:hypothetical protein